MRLQAFGLHVAKHAKNEVRQGLSIGAVRINEHISSSDFERIVANYSPLAIYAPSMPNLSAVG
jgi:hypothetical protein